MRQLSVQDIKDIKKVDTKTVLNKLPKKAKIATSKALMEIGFSQARIADIMHLDPAQVNRYVHEESDKQYQDFGNHIKKIWLEQDFKLSQMALERIEATYKSAKLYQAIGLLKTVREFNIPRGNTEGVNVNGNNVAVQIVRKITHSDTTGNNEPK